MIGACELYDVRREGFGRMQRDRLHNAIELGGDFQADGMLGDGGSCDADHLGVIDLDT